MQVSIINREKKGLIASKDEEKVLGEFCVVVNSI